MSRVEAETPAEPAQGGSQGEQPPVASEGTVGQRLSVAETPGPTGDAGDMLQSTLQSVQNQAQMFANGCNDSIDSFAPWFNSKMELAQYRVTLGIPVDLASTRASLVNGFVWATVCACGMGLGQVAGHSPGGAGTLENILTHGMAFLLAQFILPLWFYTKLQTRVPSNGKFQVVMLSTVMGVLCGYSLAPHPMEMMSMPPGCFQCILMALVLAHFPDPNPDRAMFLVAMIGSTVCVSVMLAIFMNQMSNAFMASLLLSVAVGIFNLQISIAAAKDGDAAEGLAVLLFGSYSAQTLDYLVIYFIGQTSKQREEL